MEFCIPKELVDSFLGKLKSGEINPESLTKMKSQERNEYFSKFLGKEMGTRVNALFESKLLLKNQQTGIINWAKEVAGLKPQIKKDTLTRVKKLTKVLEPDELDDFLADLAEQKLGFSVSREESKNLVELEKVVSEKKAKMKEDFTFDSESDRLDYGRSLVRFMDYVEELKLSTKEKPTISKAIVNLAGLTKSLKASLDNSVIGRQGIKTLFSQPKIWLKNSIKSFDDIVRTFGGKEVLKEVRADVLSRKNALNGLYNKERLAVGVIEEAYPTHLPQKIPLIGKAFKASEEAFTSFQYRTRADLFDKFIDIAEKTGADITGYGKLANSMTGRGSIGKFEPAASMINNIFFSPRFLKSNFDTLTAHLFDSKLGKPAKKEAALNLLKMVSGISGVLAIANAVSPGSVEVDPRSADFGKIKVGNTRFDVTGGMGSLVTLASRIITSSSKSSVSKQVKKLNSGDFGAETTLDVIYNFAENKLSPISSMLRDILEGKDYQGNKPTIKSELANLTVPIPITTFQEMQQDPNSAPILFAMIAEGLGFSTNTYSQKFNWETSDSKELQQFKQKVGEQRFKEANDLFNQKYNEWYYKTIELEKFKALSDEEKKSIITKKKSEIKKDIFLDYHFKYKESSKKLPKF